MKLKLLWCTNRVQPSGASFVRLTRPRRRRTSLVRNGMRAFSFAATAVMIGCAGFSTSTETVGDSGTGASIHTVDLSWNVSTSPDVSGYNIYRAVYTDSCGSFFKINPILITSTRYTDSEVIDGASYCYATTAVDTSNQESGYSNIVADVQIPTS